MFHIKITRDNRDNDHSHPTGNIQYVAVPEQFLGQTQYFQIFENGLPLNGLNFQNEKEARQKLSGLIKELIIASNGWYRVENRTRSSLPVRNVLGIRKIYSDGSAVNVTYVIRKITMQQRG